MSLNHQDHRPRRKADGRRVAAAGLAVAAGLMALAPAARAQEKALDQTQSFPTAHDPLEGLNRASFKLSMGVDKVILSPIAHGYIAITPKVVRNRVSSAVYNLGEPNSFMNHVLQGKPKRAARTTARFVVNSTVGVLGLFDVAAKMGLPPRGADFGQTFGVWGAKPGAFLYVPVMGPLNVRDGVGRALDFVTDPVSLYVGGLETDFGKARAAVTVVDIRTQTDPAFHALKDAADPYVTARSAYTQYREAFVREATGESQELPDFDAPPPEAPKPAQSPSGTPKP